MRSKDPSSLPPSPSRIEIIDNQLAEEVDPPFPTASRQDLGPWVLQMQLICFMHIHGIVHLVMLRGVNRPQFTIHPWRGRAGQGEGEDGHSRERSTTAYGAVRYSMMQLDSHSSALPLQNAVVYCSLAPVMAHFVADGNMKMEV